MRRVALAAALLLPLLAVPSHADGTCQTDVEVRNAWHAMAAVGRIAQQQDDPCRLIAVGSTGPTSTSDDGGTTWQQVGTAPSAASFLVTTEGLTLLAGERGGLWSTPDRGRSWVAAAGITGRVRTVVARDAQRVYAVVDADASPVPVALPVAASGGLLQSDDGGRRFNPVGSASGLAVSSVAPDAGVPSRLWVGVAGAAGGLFRSDDGGQTLLRVSGGDVRDLASSRIAGGGSEVLAATGSGFLLSRDDGTTVVTRSAGTAFDEVAFERDHSSAFLALAAGPKRSSDDGVSTRAQDAGLPATCAAAHLSAGVTIPSVFLIDCADGRTYRYRSDGTDLSATDLPDGGTPPLPGSTVNTVVATPMKELVTHKVASPGSRQDGSVAFDGSTLYYADSAGRGVVHRMEAATGRALPDFDAKGPGNIVYLTYDANRDHLIVSDTSPSVWDVDLHTRVGVRLFTAPSASNMTMTFDNATEHLLFAYEGDSFDEFTLAGRFVRSCVGLDLPVTVIVRGGATSDVRPAIAGLVATGDGLVYAESEDDSTIYRIDRSCHVLATFSHKSFNEAPAENDALACDSVTFGRPAIWLRDPEGSLTAFAIDAGYCALPSAVSVSAPPAVAAGRSGLVCATLIASAKKIPLAGLPVDLLVAGRGIGRPTTDANGRACTPYQPLSTEAGGGAGTSQARQPVLAAFLGTPAYRPSSATRSLVVSRAVTPLPAVVPPVPPVSQPAPPQLVVAPPPPPPLQPPPAPPQAPQGQSIAQSHPGAQPGAMGALGAAPAPEDEEQAAVQTSDVHKMTSLTDAPWEAYALPMLSALAMGTAAARRRRGSRVRVTGA